MHNVFPHSLVQALLPNGLRLVCQPEPNASATVLSLCLSVGGRHDPPGRSGMAHLCEHLLCNGLDEAGQALERQIREAGGSSSGSTFQDRTRFEETLPPDRLEIGLAVAAHRLAPAACELAPARLSREIGVLVQERRERESNPLVRETELLHRLLYPEDHPYHRPPVGLADDLRAITVDDVAGFLADRYRPDAGVLAVVGAVDPDEVLQRLEELLRDVPAPAPEPRRPPSSTVPAGSRRESVTAPGPQARDYLAFAAPGYGTEGGRVAALAARCLAAGRSNALQRRLAGEAGIAAVVRTFVEPMRDATTVAFSAIAPPGVDANRLREALVEAVEYLLTVEPGAAALTRARKMTLIEHYTGLERLAVRADRLACDELFGAAERLADHDRLVSAVDLERLLAWGRRLCRAERRAELTIVPEGAA